MQLSKNAKYLLRERYCSSGETPLQLFDRVAESLSFGDSKFQKNLSSAMKKGIFLPASPTLKNAGIKNRMLHPCHVLPISDSIEGIMGCLSNSAQIFHHGGGIGFNISKLRPKGSKLSTGGTSSGVVHFLKLFDNLIEVVKQGGIKRGAGMCVLDYYHPEITPFIISKLTGELGNFNISVMVNNSFMEKVNTDEKIQLIFGGETYSEVKAKDLFDQIVFSAYCSGDPGILFFDRINKDNKFYPGKVIDCVNTCGEVPLPPWTCCNLGAINLSKFVSKEGNFNYRKFSEVVELGIRTLLNINKIGWYPFPQMKEQMRKLNPCGLGFMGFADALIKMGIKYDSEDTLNFLDAIAEPYVEITDYIAKDSFYKRSQQPTGSLSIIADCSSGIEPPLRRKFESINIVEEEKELYKSKYCRDAHEISPEWHLKIQAKIQKYVDSGVSKTVNLPSDASVEDVRNIYYKAWEMGCKGITVFRDGCKEGMMRRKCEGDTCIL